MNFLTPGWKSTAFWTTNFLIIGAFLGSASKLLPVRYAAYAAVTSAVCYMMSRGIKKLSDLEVAKGWKTSEFAVGVLTLLVGVLSQIKGILPPSEAAVCASVIASAFSLSQGLAQYGTALSSLAFSFAPMQTASFAPATAAPVAAPGFVSVPDAYDPMNPPEVEEPPTS